MAGFDSLLPNFSSDPFKALRAPGYGEIHKLAKNQSYDFIKITAISLQEEKKKKKKIISIAIHPYFQIAEQW